MNTGRWYKDGIKRRHCQCWLVLQIGLSVQMSSNKSASVCLPAPWAGWAAALYVAIGTIDAPRYPRYPLVKERPDVGDIHWRHRFFLISTCVHIKFNRYHSWKTSVNNPQRVSECNFVFKSSPHLNSGQLRFIQQWRRLSICSLFLLTHHRPCWALPQLSGPSNLIIDALFKRTWIWFWGPPLRLWAPQILT